MIFIDIEAFPNFTSHVFPFYLFLLKFDESTLPFAKKILSLVDFARVLWTLQISLILFIKGNFFMKSRD